MGLWDRYSKGEAGNNYPVNDGGAQEGWTGKEVNNWGRQEMSELRQFAELQEWINPLSDIGTPRVAIPAQPHSLTIEKVNATAVRILALGAANMARAQSYYLSGRRARINSASETAYGTILSTTIETDNLRIDFEAVSNTTTTNEVPANPLNVAVYMVDPSESDASTGVLTSGIGDQTLRDNSYSSPGKMQLWYRTDTRRLEVGNAGAWEDPLALAAPIFSAASLDPLAQAQQTIEAGLLSNNGAFQAPAIKGTAIDHLAAGLLRAQWTHDATDLVVSLLDTDESTVLAAYKYLATGDIAIDRQDGNGFNVPYLSFLESADNSDVVVPSVGPTPVDTGIGLTVTWAGLTEFEVYCRNIVWPGGSNPDVSVRVGATATAADPELLDLNDQDQLRDPPLHRANGNANFHGPIRIRAYVSANDQIKVWASLQDNPSTFTFNSPIYIRAINLASQSTA